MFFCAAPVKHTVSPPRKRDLCFGVEEKETEVPAFAGLTLWGERGIEAWDGSVPLTLIILLDEE